MIFVLCLCITVHTPSEHVTVNDVTVNDVTTTIAPTDNGDGCSGVERSSGVVLGGVVGGIGVGIFQTLVVIVVVVVILLIKKGITDLEMFVYYIEQLP